MGWMSSLDELFPVQDEEMEKEFAMLLRQLDELHAALETYTNAETSERKDQLSCRIAVLECRSESSRHVLTIQSKAPVEQYGHSWLPISK